MLRLLQISNFIQIKVQSVKKKGTRQKPNTTPKQKPDMLDLKIKNSSPVKDTCKRMKRRQTGENVCKTHVMSDQHDLSQNIQECLKLNNKMARKTI